MTAFTEDGPPRIVFGRGAEARVPEELVALGARRVLVVCAAGHRHGADRLATALGERCVGVFDRSEPHVPVAVAEAARAMARETGADWVVAHGGGSAVGVAKAVALVLDVAIGAVPTPYAGSEMTDIHGLTVDDRKITGRDARVRPRLVVYDPELVAALRPAVAAASLFNALAHAVEALYAPDATPPIVDRAEEAVVAIVTALRDPVAVDEALYGAYLAADLLGRVRMGLHHQLCHVLGGFGTPHAKTHAALLPYTLAHNLAGAPDALSRLERALGQPDPPAVLWDLADGLGLPTRLSAFGVGRDTIPRWVELTLERPYPNPVPPSADGLQRTLSDAVLGRRPSRDVRPLWLAGVEGVHAGLHAARLGPELETATGAVLTVHGRGGTAETMLAKIEDPGRHPDLVWIAPQADANTWYPKPFRDLDGNREARESAFSALDAAWRAITAHLPPERVVVLGWSQGACLTLSWLSARGLRPGAIVAWTGAAIPTFERFAGLSGVPAYVGTADLDPWVAVDDVQRTAAALREAGAVVELAIARGDDHRIRPADQAALHRLLAR